MTISPALWDKLATSLRHALITAAAVGLVYLAQDFMKWDFGNYTVLVDACLAAIVRFLSKFMPNASTPDAVISPSVPPTV